jgi:hypothetical protein
MATGVSRGKEEPEGLRTDVELAHVGLCKTVSYA